MNVGLHEATVRLLIWLVAALLTADVVLIGGLLIQRFLTPNSGVSLLEIGPFIIAAGVLLALLTFTITIRRGRSEDLVEAATDLLEKAYEALSPRPGTDQPPNHRLTWLSAARLIQTAENIATRITEESHRLIYREKREYWRGRDFAECCGKKLSQMGFQIQGLIDREQRGVIIPRSPSSP